MSAIYLLFHMAIFQKIRYEMHVSDCSMEMGSNENLMRKLQVSNSHNPILITDKF